MDSIEGRLQTMCSNKEQSQEVPAEKLAVYQDVSQLLKDTVDKIKSYRK